MGMAVDRGLKQFGIKFYSSKMDLSDLFDGGQFDGVMCSRGKRA